MRAAEAQFIAALRDNLAGAGADNPVPAATNDEELKEVLHTYLGIVVPDKRVCKMHCSPFRALADAYFAREPMMVWHASRGLGGKSVLLAALGLIEAITLGAAVNLLGGSGEQSRRVHEYMRGEEPTLPDRFWKWPGAPRYMLESEPTARLTRLSNRGQIGVLMASQRSVRGPHPQRLRLDEVDEMDRNIFDASLGQAMPARGVMENTVASSTWQNPDGTMTYIMQQAAERSWPVYTWCYRENLGTWLSEKAVERKRATVPATMWETEYELQEPSGEGRAIMPGSVDKMFRAEFGTFLGDENEYIEVEPPDPNGSYVTAGDWAKRSDWTVIWTIRDDVSPMRVAAFRRTGRRPWPEMVSYYNQQASRYHSVNVHDRTGLGDVVDDLLEVDSEGIVMAGRARQDLLSNYIAAIENDEYVAPMINFAYRQHKHASKNDLYGSGHPPDTIVAGALAHLIQGGWERGT